MNLDKGLLTRNTVVVVTSSDFRTGYKLMRFKEWNSGFYQGPLFMRMSGRTVKYDENIIIVRLATPVEIATWKVKGIDDIRL